MGERDRMQAGCENSSVSSNGTPTMQQNMRLCRLSKSPFVHRAKGNGLERAIHHYEELTSLRVLTSYHLTSTLPR